jgi:hypothetical protein
MNARTSSRAVAAVFLIFWTAAAVAAQDQKIPGQAQLPILQDGFKFVPGTWTSYSVFDKAKNETYALKFSALQRETIKGRSYSWLEIEIEMKDTPSVVTSILAEETGQGPGRIEKAIVQVKGMSPFTVPRKYLEGQDQTVGEFKPARIVRKLESRKAVCGGKTIDVLAVEAEDDQGGKVTAQVSLQLPPITVYEAETAEIKMTALDFGGGAKTKIDGLPLPFALWLIEVTADALTKKK